MKNLDNSSKVILSICAILIIVVLFEYVKYENLRCKHEEMLIENISKIPNIQVDSTKTQTIILNNPKLNNPTKHLINEQYIQHQIDKNIFSNLSFFIPLILALFTGIFTYFAFLTQNHMKKAEDFKKESELLKDKIEKTSLKLEEDTKETLHTLTKKIDDSKDEFDYKIELSFTIFNDFLKDKYKIDNSILPDLIDLWNIKRTKFAVMKIAAKDKKGKSLPYLEKRLHELEGSSNPTDSIKDTIVTIGLAISHIKKQANIS